MNRILKSLAIICLFAYAHTAFSPVTASAQSAPPKNDPLPSVDELAEKCARAVGGKEAWARLSTLVLTGTIDISAAGMSGKIDVFAKSPNKSAHTISLAGGQFVEKQGFDGQVGWKLDSQSGLKRLEGDELENARIEAVFDTDLKLKEVYPDMKVVGRAKIGDRDAFAVLTHKPGGKTATFYFDAKTGLRIGEDSEAPEKDGKREKISAFFEDYRSVAGIQIPFRTRVTSPTVSFVVNVQEVRHNVAVDDSIFAMPASNQVTNDAGVKTETPADTPDEGEVEGNVYRNRFFAMQYAFPQGWTVHGDATKKRIMEIGKNAVAGDNAVRRAAMETAEKHTQVLLSVFEHPLGTPTAFNQAIQIIAEDVSYAPGIQTGKDYLQNIAGTLKTSNISAEIPGEPIEARVGDKTFYRLDLVLHPSAKDVYEAFFVGIIKQRALAFLFIAGSPEDRAALAKSLDSVRFDK